MLGNYKNLIRPPWIGVIAITMVYWIWEIFGPMGGILIRLDLVFIYPALAYFYFMFLRRQMGLRSIWVSLLLVIANYLCWVVLQTILRIVGMSTK
jgi:ABC-type Co2+ transport system permease subunit